MKKMIRWIALVVCAAMLLSASAMAAGKELTFENFQVTMTDGAEETALDLSGVGLKLGFAEQEGAVGMHLGLTAGEKTVADIRAGVQGEQILLAADGISSVYSLALEQIAGQMMSASGLSFSEADLAAAAGLMDEAMTVFATCVTPAGTQEVDGETWDVYEIAVSGDQINGILQALAVVLDAHPELFADSEYANFSEMIADMKAEVSIQGVASAGFSGFSAEIYLIATNIETGEQNSLVFFANGASAIMEEEDSEHYAVSLELGAVDEDGNVETAAEIYGGVILIGGELANAEVEIVNPEEENAGLTASLYTPAITEDGGWYFEMSTLDGETTLVVQVVNGGCYVVIGSEEEYVAIGWAVENGVIGYSLDSLMDGAQLKITANGTVTDTDGAWMIPAGSESIDIMSMSDQQSNVLMMEGMSVLMGALSSLAQANNTLASLISSMM